MIEPNPSIDELVLQKEIDFKVEGAPAMNFKNMRMEPFSIFHYDVQLYKNTKGERYYLFSCYDDCTLYIMNCNKDIYDILKQNFIEISDDTDIFECSNKDRGTSLEFVPVPKSYRYEKGPSGTPVIFTD